MTGEIVIDFTRSEGAVLRLIGQVERRGFEVTSMSLPEHGAGPARLTLGVTARDASRRFDTLSRHVSKTYGVTAVRAAESAPPCMERAS
jgi:acetolactate synthase regulatory subunit